MASRTIPKILTTRRDPGTCWKAGESEDLGKLFEHLTAWGRKHKHLRLAKTAGWFIAAGYVPSGVRKKA